jgi:hypothetical protein
MEIRRRSRENEQTNGFVLNSWLVALPVSWMAGPAWPVAAAARAVADGGFCQALRASDTKKAGH